MLLPRRHRISRRAWKGTDVVFSFCPMPTDAEHVKTWIDVTLTGMTPVARKTSGDDYVAPTAAVPRTFKHSQQVEYAILVLAGNLPDPDSVPVNPDILWDDVKPVGTLLSALRTRSQISAVTGDVTPAESTAASTGNTEEGVSDEASVVTGQPAIVVDDIMPNNEPFILWETKGLVGVADAASVVTSPLDYKPIVRIKSEINRRFRFKKQQGFIMYALVAADQGTPTQYTHYTQQNTGVTQSDAGTAAGTQAQKVDAGFSVGVGCFDERLARRPVLARRHSRRPLNRLESRLATGHHPADGGTKA